MIKKIYYVLKSFANLVSKCINTVLWLFRAFVLTDLRNHIQKEQRSTLLILANGPSLSKDLASIDNHEGELMAVNFFYKSPYFQELKPSYYVLADPFFFSDEQLMLILDAVCWPMTLYVPYRYWKTVRLMRMCPNKHIQVIPYHTGHYMGFDCFRTWIYKHGLSMPVAQNVLIPCIFNAINMGYKTIKLYGADHSWTETIRVNSSNEVCLVDSHFYDNSAMSLKPWKKLTGETYLMHEVLRDLAQMFDSYHYVRKYADQVGCKIINCTKNSFIDAFERAN